MAEGERRFQATPSLKRLESQLNIAQVLTLRELEHFGWELKIVRMPMFEPPVAIVFDGSRTLYGVIESDGSLNESPSLHVRH